MIRSLPKTPRASTDAKGAAEQVAELVGIVFPDVPGLRVSDIRILGVVRMNLPPGRSTRCTSRTSSMSCLMCSITWNEMTKSKLPDGRSRGGTTACRISTCGNGGRSPAGSILSSVRKLEAWGRLFRRRNPCPYLFRVRRR